MLLTTREWSGAFSPCQPFRLLIFAELLLLRTAQSGDEGIRTPDLRRAKAALSQLSYIPGGLPG
jgi:hypothetical protein